MPDGAPEDGTLDGAIDGMLEGALEGVSRSWFVAYPKKLSGAMNFWFKPPLQVCHLR